MQTELILGFYALLASTFAGMMGLGGAAGPLTVPLLIKALAGDKDRVVATNAFLWVLVISPKSSFLG